MTSLRQQIMEARRNAQHARRVKDVATERLYLAIADRLQRAKAETA